MSIQTYRILGVEKIQAKDPAERKRAAEGGDTETVEKSNDVDCSEKRDEEPVESAPASIEES